MCKNNKNTTEKDQEIENLEAQQKKQKEKKDKKVAKKKAAEKKAAEEKTAKKKNKDKDTVKSEKDPKKTETVVETPPKKKEEKKAKVEVPTPAPTPENKSEAWKVILLAVLVIIIGFLIWGASDDNIAGSTKNGNRLDSLETTVETIQGRIGTFDNNDAATLSQKIGVLNDNQIILEGDMLSVRSGISSNKKRSITNGNRVKKLNKKVNHLSSRVTANKQTLQNMTTIVKRLKTERCSDWLNTGNSGLNCK